MLKKLLTLILSLILLTTTTGVFAHQDLRGYSKPSETASSGGLIDDLNANLRKQEELRKKIADAQAREKSLSSEIVYLDNQINLTQLEIEEAQTRLAQLSVDIDEVTDKLGQTRQDLDYSQTVADSRLRAIYKQGFVGPVDTFLGSGSFNDYLIRQKYTEVVRAQDIELLDSLEAFKNEYASQKITLEDKQAKEEALKRDLEQKRADLAEQESSKQYILGVTKNNEKEYQRLLAQVQSEIEAIAKALGGGGVRLGPVRRGEVIAFQGNSGCSTGTHLHFGLYIGGGAANPKSYLDSGALSWPEKGFTVTQWFGANYWWYMNNFGIPGHNGIDMTAGWGAPIYAARDGVAYLATDSSACWLTGTVGKGIVIHHSNGWRTIYWHIR
ncbi:MAG TPA: peptidoglycan DD-metalloendopeptidase family protein [Candidatus Nanoarchaeia archaeon]